jgi:uncharacterized hydrophobic protein (TIGR00271 family)
MQMHTGSNTMPQTTQVSGASQRRLQVWLRIGPEALPTIYQQVFATAELTSLLYWLEIFFAAGIATFGLVENSPAVIIGAMLISPVMGPIMATGLALAVNLLASVTMSVAFSGFLVWLLPFHYATSEILARTKPNLLDLGIALLSGLAGSVAVSRGGSDGATAIPGVAIAVALMPPLCTIGFGLGTGLNLQIMGGAGLLFLTNLVAIVASAFLVFLLLGMSASETRGAMFASRARVPLPRFFSEGTAARLLAAGGQLRWRVVMLVILLASIAVPLRRALLEVANETSIRTAVQYELKRLVPSGELVSQQVTFGPDEIAIRLISTSRVPEAELTRARQDLMRKTGRDVKLSVEAVASKSELAELMDRLARPAPEAPKEQTPVEIQKELLDKVQSAIERIWPSSDAPIQDFDVQIGSAGTTVNVRYQGAADLGQIPTDMIRHSLQTSLGISALALNAERVFSSLPSAERSGAIPKPTAESRAK